MERPIVVITTGIRSSRRKIPVGSHAMDPRDARCARLTRRMSFLGWSNDSGKRTESLLFAQQQTRRRKRRVI
jgi:hypothetical protein